MGRFGRKARAFRRSPDAVKIFEISVILEGRIMMLTLLNTMSPMLAKISAPFHSEDYVFEVKWDGIRVIAFIENGRIRKLQSRNGRNISEQLPEVMDSRVQAKRAILDGEMIALGEDGKPSISRIFNRLHPRDSLKVHFHANSNPALYMVFDLLHLDGRSLLDTPLLERKKLMERVIQDCDCIVPCVHTDGNGMDFFEAVTGMGLEGIVAKRKGSPYRPGKRSEDWLKIKSSKTGECYITGFTFADGTKTRIGDLILGDLFQGRWISRGRIKNGIGVRDWVDLLSAFKPVSHDRKMIRIEPVKIEVRYFEIEESGAFRWPIFRRILR
jgi:bifunctional non-homologous end joining protein LigD